MPLSFSWQSKLTYDDSFFLEVNVLRVFKVAEEFTFLLVVLVVFLVSKWLLLGLLQFHEVLPHFKLCDI
jgi:hypothetical protein